MEREIGILGKIEIAVLFFHVHEGLNGLYTITFLSWNQLLGRLRGSYGYQSNPLCVLGYAEVKVVATVNDKS